MTNVKAIPAVDHQILACPRCKGSIDEQEGHISCRVCGEVGTRTFGFYDFLSRQQTLELAGGGSFDLVADREAAADLLARDEGLSFSELLHLDAPERESASRAEQKFADRYWRTCEEVGLSHGRAILTKVNGYLRHKGRHPIYKGVVIEAGGGQGFFIADFSEYFSHVVFVDCSLRNLVLAHRMAEELAITNVLFLRADVTALPVRHNIADMVHGNGVIEHVASPQAMVNEGMRVLTLRGTYVCLSPNRYPISPEPHFRLPLFGLFPAPLRRRLIRVTRGVADEAGTDLLSLRRLKRCFKLAGVVPETFFLPPALSETARPGIIRRSVRAVLNAPLTARAANFILNRLLLPIAPYHIALASRSSAGADTDH